MTHALVVLSGGQDSTTTLFIAKDRHEEVHALTFHYGQLHSIEVDAALKVANLAGVSSHETVNLPPWTLASTSPLVNRTMPLEQYEGFESMGAIIGDRVEKTFVPMRNALFLTIAANRAVSLGVEYIYTGVCQADNANYPDCTESFIHAQTQAIHEALGRGKTPFVSIRTPLMDMSKVESIREALKYEGCYTALAYSHTAYDGSYPPTGKDHATILRAHGFEEANIPDPLIVRAYWEGKLAELPMTKNYGYVPPGRLPAIRYHIEMMRELEALFRGRL